MKITLFYLEHLEQCPARCKCSMLATVVIISVNRRRSCHGSRQMSWQRAWALGSDRTKFKSLAPSWASHKTLDKLLKLSKPPLSHLSGEYHIIIPIFSDDLRRCRADLPGIEWALSNRNLCCLLDHKKKFPLNHRQNGGRSGIQFF